MQSTIILLLSTIWRRQRWHRCCCCRCWSWTHILHGRLVNRTANAMDPKASVAVEAGAAAPPRRMTNWMLNRISWSYLINWKSCFDDKLWKLRTNEQRMCISDDFWQFYLNYGRFGSSFYYMIIQIRPPPPAPPSVQFSWWTFRFYVSQTIRDYYHHSWGHRQLRFPRASPIINL